MIQKVVETHACSLCGLCVAVCPHQAIELDKDFFPRIINGNCIECGICFESCPRVDMPYAAIQKEIFKNGERKNFDSLLGYYHRIFFSRSGEVSLRERCYSGGSTTTFLLHLLRKGYIDSALLVAREHDFPYCGHGKSVVARTEEEIISCAYTKPTVNGILSHLPVKGKSVAVVGTACVVEGIRKAQYVARYGHNARERCQELTANITYVIGLICFFCNRRDGLDRMLSRLRKKESDLKKFYYAKGGIPTAEFLDGKTHQWREQGNFESLNTGCLLCYPSFTAKLSDVTFGKTMSEIEGWNDAISRSDKADSLLKEMEIEGLLETREVEHRGEDLLEALLEAGVFKIDAAGYAHFLEKKKFQPNREALSMVGQRGGKIAGKELLRLLTAVRQYAFYEPAVEARKKAGVFVPELG